MQANEAAWYDEHYQQIQPDHWVCWNKFAMPYLRQALKPQTRLIELGCGQGQILRYLAREKLVAEENISGMDQSRTAVDYVRQFLPKAHLDTGDIYRLQYPRGHFDICLLMETIEHLEDPVLAMRQIIVIRTRSSQRRDRNHALIANGSKKHLRNTKSN